MEKKQHHAEALSAILHNEAVIVRTGATVEEYMAFESASEEPHEFHNGDIIKMPGVHRTHAVLVTNLIGLLYGQLRKRGRIYSEMLKLDIPAYHCIVYPDVMITLGEEEFVNDDMMRLRNPVVVMEVLSRSTEHYDRSAKLDYDRSVSSVREIVFIAQDRVLVELYRNNEDHWSLYEFREGVVPLESVQASISLQDLYDA
jgi:Uma2 family endonuclease